MRRAPESGRIGLREIQAEWTREESRLRVEEDMANRIIEKAGLDPNDCDADSGDQADCVVEGIEALRRSLDASLAIAMDDIEKLRALAAPAPRESGEAEWETTACGCRVKDATAPGVISPTLTLTIPCAQHGAAHD